MSEEQHTYSSQDQQEAAEGSHNNNNSSADRDEDINNLIDFLRDIKNTIDTLQYTSDERFNQIDERLSQLYSANRRQNTEFNDKFAELDIKVCAQLVAVQSTNEEIKKKIEQLNQITNDLQTTLHQLSRRVDYTETSFTKVKSLLHNINILIHDSELQI